MTTFPSYEQRSDPGTPSPHPPRVPARTRRPGAALTMPQLRDAVKSGQIDTVLLALPTPQGQLKGKRYGARHFVERVADNGASMCLYVLATDIDMTPHDGFDLTSWDTGYGDTTVVPDHTTIRRLPWMQRTALVLGDATGGESRPVDVAPRQILRRQLARLATYGLHVQVGLETEFVLYQGVYAPTMAIGPGGLTPLCEDNLDYALDHPPRMDRYFRHLQSALGRAGMPVEAIKSEGAPGQVEVTFPYGGALTACDQHLVFKHAARTLAARSQMTATFMASPQTGIGSGLHLHISLARAGNAILPTQDGQLSPIGRQAVAGLLLALPDLAPLYAPTINSYRRYVPGSFAPAVMTWGYDNRTCAVRVVGAGDELHLEVRLPGADANPYLAVAAAVAAICHGLDEELEPPLDCDSNSYAADAPGVPATLEHALSRFRRSPLAGTALGEETVLHYARLAEIEVEHHGAQVTGEEQRRGFTRA
ncbi:glutamine synthetase family protein [Streptomyces xanthochromogenes]|uniref:glutamine synthetase family protein n=1 Tax=Streptomyces xanthochromogenes TaxID=67384 RepID=UPI00341A0E32